MVVNATRAFSAHGVLTPKMKVFYFNLQATGSSYWRHIAVEEVGLDAHVKFGDYKPNHSWIMRPAHFVLDKQTTTGRNTVLMSLNETL